MQFLSFEEAQGWVGKDLGASEWKLIDQPLVDAFAAVTGDHQFIHVDPEAAAKTPFGGTIAHGFLTLSLLSSLLPPDMVLVKDAKMSVNYGFEKIRFLQPVRVGARVRARHVLARLEARGPGQILATRNVTVEIEGESKPALIAEWLGLQVL